MGGILKYAQKQVYLLKQSYMINENESKAEK